MLITKFNKLIRNRLIWAFVAVLVSVSFVLSAGAVKGCKTDERQSGMGELFGRKVSREEFLTARFFEMGLRDQGAMTPEAEQALSRRTWLRLAMLREADKMGLTASNEEVAQLIQRDPTFAENGVFNRERYRAVVESSLRIPRSLFEAYVRQDITLRKISAVAESLLWIPPSDLQRRLANLTDNMKVEYALLPREENPAAAVQVGEEDARAFYEANTNLFIVPEKIRVRYVAFPVSNYLGSSTVKDADIERFYDDNLQNYMTVDTNGASIPVPIEDVKEQIRSNLLVRAATFKAKDNATGFVMALAPERNGNAPDMAAVAAQAGLSIRTTDYFSAFEDVPGLDVGASFRQAAFNLDEDDPNSYFSDAVVDGGEVYVIASQDRVPIHLPPFTNIVELVMPRAVSNAVRKAMVEKAGEIRAEILAAGTNAFTRVMSEHGALVVTSEVFSVYEGIGSNDLKYTEALLPELVTMGPGDVSSPIESGDGVILAHLLERAPGEIGLVDYLKPQLRQTLTGYLSGALYAGWGEHILKQGEFRDFTAASEDEDEEEEDAEGVPAENEELL